MGDDNINFCLTVRDPALTLNKIITPEELDEFYKQLNYNEMNSTAEYNNDHEALLCLNDIPNLEIHYRENYNVKGLSQILQYYGIAKKKMTKDEMIQMLIFYETDPTHRMQALDRLRLWQNIAELKSNSFFSKYILFDI